MGAPNLDVPHWPELGWPNRVIARTAEVPRGVGG